MTLRRIQFCIALAKTGKRTSSQNTWRMNCAFTLVIKKDENLRMYFCFSMDCEISLSQIDFVITRDHQFHILRCLLEAGSVHWFQQRIPHAQALERQKHDHNHSTETSASMPSEDAVRLHKDPVNQNHSIMNSRNVLDFLILFISSFLDVIRVFWITEDASKKPQVDGKARSHQRRAAAEYRKRQCWLGNIHSDEHQSLSRHSCHWNE